MSEALPKWRAVEAENADHILRTVVACGDSSMLIAPANWVKRRLGKSLSSEVDLLINVAAALSLGQRLYQIAKEVGSPPAKEVEKMISLLFCMITQLACHFEEERREIPETYVCKQIL